MWLEPAKCEPEGLLTIRPLLAIFCMMTMRVIHKCVLLSSGDPLVSSAIYSCTSIFVLILQQIYFSIWFSGRRRLSIAIEATQRLRCELPLKNLCKVKSTKFIPYSSRCLYILYICMYILVFEHINIANKAAVIFVVSTLFCLFSCRVKSYTESTTETKLFPLWCTLYYVWLFVHCVIIYAHSWSLYSLPCVYFKKSVHET